MLHTAKASKAGYRLAYTPPNQLFASAWDLQRYFIHSNTDNRYLHVGAERTRRERGNQGQGSKKNSLIHPMEQLFYSAITRVNK